MAVAEPIRSRTPLIGRDDELAEVRMRLTDPRVRLLTVTGPVGVGKSRFVAALAEDVSPAFEGGGGYLDLTDTEPARDLDDLVAESMTDLSTAASGFPALPRDQRFLLVLDGCDRLTATLATRLTGLLSAYPQLTVLVASPARLGIYGEVVVRLALLQVPDPTQAADPAALSQIPAVRLFVERTQAIRPDFRLTDANQAAVAELCARTDGLPLAIELLAARMALSSPQRLLAELDRDIGSLAGSGSDTLSRHHSMMAALESSLDLLSADERLLIGRLAVFAGYFDAAAAAAVGGTTPEQTCQLMAGLMDKNLLRTAECPDGDLIFRLFRLTRRYLLQDLQQTEDYRAIRRAHAEYVLALAASGPDSRGLDRAPQLELVGSWHEDILMALTYLDESGDKVSMGRLASALRDHWRTGWLTEGIRWLTGSGRLTPQGAGVLGELLIEKARLDAAEHGYSGDLVAADRLSGTEQGAALLDLAGYLFAANHGEQASRLTEAALREFTRHQDMRGIAHARYVLADIASSAGDRKKAIRLCRKALSGLRELPDPAGHAAGLERLAVLLIGGPGCARKELEQAVCALGAAAGLRASTGHVAPPALSTAVVYAESLARAWLGDQAVDECLAAGAAQPADRAIAEAITPAERQPTVRPRSLARQRNEHLLTRREWEVAELVACGMTNREVARRLGIAEWTAVNHLRKIMRKLDCSSRVQVAGWITQRGRNAHDEAEAG
ncbi:LuxR C-terminal-related transcriptional regulator [Kibdelosporangium aridum]|nr:LuxR C-terminal-related transcriptional regulator [Kibdelosporangium aridum]